MFKHTRTSTAFLLFLISIFVVQSKATTAQSESLPSGIGAVWVSPSFNDLQTSPDERQQIAAAISLIPNLEVQTVTPYATFSDPTNDLLFKWLNPDNADYGLSVSGSTIRSVIPDGPLGFPTNYYWNVVTFNRYDPALAVFDSVPDYGSIWWNGTTPQNYTDGANSGIPAFADLRQIGVTRSGVESKWQLTSASEYPGLPAAYQVGYNINIQSGSNSIQQYFGANPFTPTGLWWSIRDRGNLFPGWNANLDVTEVAVDQPVQNSVKFEAKVSGTLYSSYSGTAAWPRFYWHIDSDNNLSTGDNFTFGYQEGSYVFNYYLVGIDAVAQAFYDQTTNRWLAILRKKIGPNQWETVATASPVLAGNRLTVTFADIGIYSTFRWGLVSWFQVVRGGLLYYGNVDVAPNSGMQTQTLTVDPDQALAEKYAPVLYRASGEAYFPVAIEYTLQTSVLRHDDGQITSPRVEDLIAPGIQNGYLDLDGERPSESQASWNNGSGRNPAVYARVVRGANTTVIQYWFHYYYSSWGYTKGCDWPGAAPCLIGNNHEGDWEMIQVVLKDNLPEYAVYAQHVGGSKRPWKYTEKQGDRPIVYVGWGSHASFFKDAYYFQLGFASETTGRISTAPLQIKLLPSDSDPPWLQFKGQWGADEGIPGTNYDDSPSGPRWDNPNDDNGRDNWRDPVIWGEQKARWDEDENYGGCKSGYVEPNRIRNWRMCISGAESRYITPVLYDTSNNVLISPDVNNVDASGRRAEYLLNCANNSQQSIILYKTTSLTGVGRYVFSRGSDRCGATAANVSLTTSETLTITFTLPKPDAGQVLVAEFSNIVVTGTTVGQIRFDVPTLQLEFDYNNDGTIDATVAPSTLTQQLADFTPPNAVSDLTAVQGRLYVDLHWTAPGNDGTQGTATYYDVRYAKFPVTQETWEYAIPIPHSMAPSAAGTVERLRVEMLPPGRYFFAIRTFDQDYNVSGGSNTVEGTIKFGVFLPLIRR